jgi:murein DD-endopeptidase MepM/ murein hydrolase activator NlpD
VLWAHAVPAQLKWALSVLALACAALALLWLSLLLGSDPVAGLRVEGQPVPASAVALERALNERAEQWAESELEIRAQDTLGVTRISRAALGASLPVRSMLAAARAVGHSGNPLLDLGKWWSARRGELDLRWSPHLNSELLARFVESEQVRVEELPIAGVSDGHGYSLRGREGHALDVATALASLTKALAAGMGGPSQIELPIQRVAPPPPITIGSPDGALFDEEAPAASVAPANPNVASAQVRLPDQWQPPSRDDCYSDPPQRPFCDGPRQVPLPHGPALALAQALGLGQLDTVGQLIRHEARPDWVRAAAAARDESAGLPGAEAALWPVPAGRLGRGFGYVRRPELRDRIHAGVDIVAATGSQILASRAGIVAYSDNRVRGYGNLLLIVHGNGDVTLNAHCQRIFVFAGERVARGQVVAEVGMTGLALGPHLHFELRVAGNPTDPQPSFASTQPSFARARTGALRPVTGTRPGRRAL